MAHPRRTPDGPAWEPDLHLANERIADRHRDAHTTRAGRSAAPIAAGSVERLRHAIGTRLIALGTILAAPERPLVR